MTKTVEESFKILRHRNLSKQCLLSCSDFSVSILRFCYCVGCEAFQGLQQMRGQVVQSIISLTSLLRGQLVKCFTTL